MVKEKSGNFVSSQGNSKFYLKVRKKSGNLIFGQPLGLGKGFLVGKDNVVSKGSYE